MLRLFFIRISQKQHRVLVEMEIQSRMLLLRCLQSSMIIGKKEIAFIKTKLNLMALSEQLMFHQNHLGWKNN